MNKCPICGEELEDGAVFCTNCGAKLSVECPKCGKVLKSGAIFCSGCGANLAELTKPTACPNCGAELEDDAQYCDQCGHRIGGEQIVSTSVPPVSTVQQKTETTESSLLNFIPLEQADVSVLATPVTQKLYESIMGYNPSYFDDDAMNPVETVTWYDAIRFCNKLSMKYHKQPVYSVSGETDPDCIDDGDYVVMDSDANGYRLLTLDEWKHAANVAPPDYLSPDDDDYEDPFPFSPENNNSEESWYPDNSDDRTHSVAKKQPNELGFYDMFGNVWEWIWDTAEDDLHSFHVADNGTDDFKYYCGGSYRTSFSFGWFKSEKRKQTLGFRIAYTLFNESYERQESVNDDDDYVVYKSPYSDDYDSDYEDYDDESTEEKIRKIVDKYIYDIDKNSTLYKAYKSTELHDPKYSQVLQNICSYIAKDASSSEIIGFIDTTLIGKGKAGLVFTTEAIYHKELGDFWKVTYWQIKKEGSIRIGDTYYNIPALKDCLGEIFAII